MQYYLGIDIGGMTVKGILADKGGKSYADGSIATDSDKGANKMYANIAELIDGLIKKSKVNKAEITGVGIGCPGIIDSKNGVVVFAGNLDLHNFPLVKEIEKTAGLPVKLTNDANAAALGEAKFGAGSKYKNSILITLGTGVGGGIVIDGKLFEGGKSAGTEIGHTVIVENGLKIALAAGAAALKDTLRHPRLWSRRGRLWKPTATARCGRAAT